MINQDPSRRYRIEPWCESSRFQDRQLILKGIVKMTGLVAISSQLIVPNLVTYLTLCSNSWYRNGEKGQGIELL